MKLPKEGYFSKFDHVEIARYFPEKDKLSRIMKDGQPVMIPWDEIYNYADEYDRVGVYHSIRHYNMNDGGIEGPSLAPMHFDIDNKDDPALAYMDTNKLLRYLLDDINIPSDAIRVYFSGMKGYHLEIEPMAIKMNLVHEDSAAIFRFVALEIADLLGIVSFDYAVYDLRRIWRLAGSKHQKTGLYKIPCKDMMMAGETFEAITKYAEQRPSIEDLTVPDQVFDYQAARFFSEVVARYETEQWEREQDKLSNFLSRGHSRSTYTGEYVKEFDPQTLRNMCPAVEEMEEKAHTTHYLDHYERLFLCSILSYADEAINFLHSILSQCEDYNFNISDLHVQDWVRRREAGTGGRPYTCGKARSVGISCVGCDGLESKKYTDGLGAEHIADPSPVRFAYKYHGTGEQNVKR